MMLFFNLSDVLLSLHIDHRFRGTTSLDRPGSSFFLRAVFLGREECLHFKGLSNPALWNDSRRCASVAVCVRSASVVSRNIVFADWCGDELYKASDGWVEMLAW